MQVRALRECAILCHILIDFLALPNSNDNDGRVGRIVGGRTATLGQFPYMVSLRTTANLHICGGKKTVMMQRNLDLPNLI